MEGLDGAPGRRTKAAYEAGDARARELVGRLQRELGRLVMPRGGGAFDTLQL